MRRRAGSRAWNSLVTLKKTSELSFFVKRLALDEQVEQLGDDLLAAAGVDVGVVEAAGVLEGGALFDAVEGGVLDWCCCCWLGEREVEGGEEKKVEVRRSGKKRSRESPNERGIDRRSKSFLSLSRSLSFRFLSAFLRCPNLIRDQ